VKQKWVWFLDFVVQQSITAKRLEKEKGVKYITMWVEESLKAKTDCLLF